MTEERAKLDDKINELITTLQGQRVLVGDKMIKMSLRLVLGMARKKAKDKEEFDKVVAENKAFQEFCQDIGLKT